ncbi:MAG: Hsp70 family protein, partial [Terriglobales bacterium]
MPLVYSQRKRARVIYDKVQELPRLGGPASGAPPPYVVATGQHSHAIIGIDIGSKFARTAVCEQRHPMMVATAPMPTAVRVNPANGQVSAGYGVDRVQEEGLISGLRGLLGSDWCFEGEGFSYDAEQLMGTVLAQVKALAAQSLGKPISKAVLTVPTAFTCSQRTALRQAAERTGLQVLQLINEPTAAALAHCYLAPEMEGTYLLFNLGASMFSTSVLEFKRGILEVKASSGDNNLGIDSFDFAIIDWLFEEFSKQHGLEVAVDPPTLKLFKDVVEQARKDLKMAPQAHIRLTSVNTIGGGYSKMLSGMRCNVFREIKREQFKALVEPLVSRTMKHVDRVLEDSRLTDKEIDHVLVIGPGADVPAIDLPLKERFGKELWGNSDGNAPALGAAIQASLLTNNARDFVVWDVLAVPVNIELKGQTKTVIAKNTPL